ncbi:PREDICTED: uncharacterized protein LOC105623924 [Atta cephalotes]|uniref:Uncharacterized protein n=1 Tax=Atta cephalotes TaxID=12957 RepID=A0A158NT30_ATTCE|nr:PREDICTED: uncharacterized protein LOC105623924 [Atta cephalotes]
MNTLGTEWQLYRNMLFLIPHIAHRKAKTSFVQQSQSSLAKTSRFLHHHSYSGFFQSIKKNTLSLDIEDQESNSTKKVIPEMDEFTKCKKMKDNKLDHELEKTMKAILSQLDRKCLEKDGYMSILEEGLKYVPLKHNLREEQRRTRAEFSETLRQRDAEVARQQQRQEEFAAMLRQRDSAAIAQRLRLRSYRKNCEGFLQTS